jgi:hypothetical protein
VFLRQLAWLGLGPLFGCRSEELPMTSPTHDSASPTNSASSSASSPTDKPSTTDTSSQPYRLDFRVRGGMVMASVAEAGGARVEIHEWMTWLRVRADLGLAMMVLGRHNGDLQGRPVGLFAVKLRADELTALRELVESTKWAQLPPPTGGDVTASNLEIDYARGDLLIRREFNARSREFIAAIGTLLEALNQKCGAMLERPANALTVVVTATPDAGEAGLVQLSFELHNIGTGPVALVDPRVPAPNGQPRARFMLTANSQDGRPPMWTPIALPPLPEGQPELLTLAAGAKLIVPMQWRATQAGAFYMRGDWLDYDGPVPSAEHASVMPLPVDLADGYTAHGPYSVRGAAFSNAVPFTIAAK